MKLQPLTKATFMNRLIWNLDRMITSRISATLPSLVKLVSAVAPPTWWWNIRVACLFFIFIIFVFIFLDTLRAYTREPILTHNSSKDADWLKEVPFKQVFFDIFTFWGPFFPKNPNISLPVGKSHAKRKCRITSNPLELRQKLPLTTNRKSRRNHDDVISSLQ